MNSSRLKNKVIIVTASTRGIGLACVNACAKADGIVYMAARNKERAETLIHSFEKAGCKVRFVYLDAMLPDSFARMVDTVWNQEKRIDVLINNFGTSDPNVDKNIEQTDIRDFLNILNANISSVFLASQAVIPYMKKGNGGSIINISSIGGTIPDISRIAYGTGKSAINHLTKLIAVQEAKNHIRCNAVLPGMTETDSVASSLKQEFKELFLKHTPLSRMAKPEEIAAAVLYFASDESAYTTGQILSVSGGFGLGTPLLGDFKITP